MALHLPLPLLGAQWRRALLTPSQGLLLALHLPLLLLGAQWRRDLLAPFQGLLLALHLPLPQSLQHLLGALLCLFPFHAPARNCACWLLVWIVLSLLVLVSAALDAAMSPAVARDGAQAAAQRSSCGCATAKTHCGWMVAVAFPPSRVRLTLTWEGCHCVWSDVLFRNWLCAP